MPDILYFPYFGPNRRSDRRVVEIRLDFHDDETGGVPHLDDIRQQLLQAGLPLEPIDQAVGETPGQPVDGYALLLARLALLFQRECGHLVSYFDVTTETDRRRSTTLVEYQHCDVGMTAVKLAIGVVTGELASLERPFGDFARFARERVLPRETLAIITAAGKRDVPCFHLEQAPFANTIRLAHRVRRNGLLMLGHGAASQVLDGTFCVSRSDEYHNALLRNPEVRQGLLRELGLAAGKSSTHREEKCRIYDLLLINGQLTVLERQAEGAVSVRESIHPSLAAMAMSVGERLGHRPLVIELTAAAVDRPVAESGARFVDFDLAPDLGDLLGHCEHSEARLNAAAEGIISWLFPATTRPRMPIIAVTGTNGKTTTCRMINHILDASRRKPGMVCTDGVFLDGRQVSDQDAGTLVGHFQVLANRGVDVAVLETHHRGIAVRGFAFSRCDIGVCLNVTEEHLVKGEIETVEEMAVIKRALVERASGAAVINADDANCRQMLDKLVADRVGLVSLETGVDELASLLSGDTACFCVVENIGGADHIVFYGHDVRHELMRVDAIPATFDGTAAFNTSNAMHAAMATWLSGVSPDTISAALKGFGASWSQTPGRMNELTGLPFRVIMDFAHNPDGMKKVSEFSDRQQVKGRKLIAIPGARSRSHKANCLAAQAVAGHFDFYFCTNYGWDRTAKDSPAPLVRDALVEAGVHAHQTKILTNGRETVFEILDDCRPGDLLVLLAGHVEIKSYPGFVQEYAARHAREG